MCWTGFEWNGDADAGLGVSVTGNAESIAPSQPRVDTAVRLANLRRVMLRNERCGSDHGSVRDDSVLGHNHDAIANVIKRVIGILRLSRRGDHDVVPDARVLVDDRVLNSRVRADADPRTARGFIGMDRFM